MQILINSDHALCICHLILKITFYLHNPSLTSQNTQSASSKKDEGNGTNNINTALQFTAVQSIPLCIKPVKKNNYYYGINAKYTKETAVISLF